MLAWQLVCGNKSSAECKAVDWNNSVRYVERRQISSAECKAVDWNNSVRYVERSQIPA